MSRHSNGEGRTALCNRRLLLDIKELIHEPYPKISLHSFDEDIHTACLVLTPDTYEPLHLTINFHDDYPLQPPTIRMDSDVNHPNVYDDYICASILNTLEGYTPAYSLKGIAIQLLSFFDSDSIDQDHGHGGSVSLKAYKIRDRTSGSFYQCFWCGFGSSSPPAHQSRALPYDARVEVNPHSWPTIPRSTGKSRLTQQTQASEDSGKAPEISTASGTENVRLGFDSLPNELLLQIVNSLSVFEDLTSFTQAWPRVSRLVCEFDIVRQRELQCFCLKQSYRSVKLGIGVSSHRGQLASEFDLLSQEGFQKMSIRESIHHIPFNYWLPLPISRLHWRTVNDDTYSALEELGSQIKVEKSKAHVLFTFMNGIVVRLNQIGADDSKSTLHHASEKAIESYFHLFHLLVCLATEDHEIIRHANRLLTRFVDGNRSKQACPNLGHLLIALLISDTKVTEKLIKDIITEAITRNVVWLLDHKGANMPELAYMETCPVSAYRLDKTFQGSLTSYRLLMFSELFRHTARPSHDQSLTQVREALFERHGGPPPGAANRLASEVRRLHTISDFPAFMREMGIRNIPSPAVFTSVLRQTVHDSMSEGYSKWAIGQRRALALRVRKDYGLVLTKGERESAIYVLDRSEYFDSVSFFPNRSGSQARNGYQRRGVSSHSTAVSSRGRGQGQSRMAGDRGGRGGRGPRGGVYRGRGY
ncbi:hypothetical protein F5Y15DRAFT_236496 [Xylariaceae sp. FL0016]|nr:hypothetical protein F5Y15DRAFT_236496 [Xylariaceae sp. FL0016]